jgi:hypothetical protein
MSLSPDFDVDAAASLSSSVRGVAWLADLEFVSGTVYYTSAPVTITANGHTYLGVGDLATVSPVGESEDSAADKITLGFSLVNTAMLAATLGNVDNYRGQRARLWLQLFDDKFQPSGVPVKRWAGFMDRVSVERKAADPLTGGPATARLNLECSRAGMARARNITGLRLTDAQQQQRYPGDLGLQYVQTLIEAPTVWLSKRFQQQ